MNKYNFDASRFWIKKQGPSKYYIPVSALIVTIIVRSAPSDSGGYFSVSALCLMAIGLVGFLGYQVGRYE